MPHLSLSTAPLETHRRPCLLPRQEGGQPSPVLEENQDGWSTLRNVEEVVVAQASCRPLTSKMLPAESCRPPGKRPLRWNRVRVKIARPSRSPGSAPATGACGRGSLGPAASTASRRHGLRGGGVRPEPDRLPLTLVSGDHVQPAEPPRPRTLDSSCLQLRGPSSTFHPD